MGSPGWSVPSWDVSIRRLMPGLYQLWAPFEVDESAMRAPTADVQAPEYSWACGQSE